MVLIGQFDSPFVRRVGVALRHYEIDFEHRALGVFADAAEIARFNPLRRVPTLVLDDGTVLTESYVCLEFLDGRVADERGPESPALLLPRNGAERTEGLRACGLATGVMDKAVALVYERVVRNEADEAWSMRCESQIRGALSQLEGERSVQNSANWLGEHLSHADVAVTCAVTFLRGAHPDFPIQNDFPALLEMAARWEGSELFSGVRQPFEVRQ